MPKISSKTIHRDLKIVSKGHKNKRSFLAKTSKTTMPNNIDILLVEVAEQRIDKGIFINRGYSKPCLTLPKL